MGCFLFIKKKDFGVPKLFRSVILANFLLGFSIYADFSDKVVILRLKLPCY